MDGNLALPYVQNVAAKRIDDKEERALSGDANPLHLFLRFSCKETMFIKIQISTLYRCTILMSFHI